VVLVLVWQAIGHLDHTVEKLNRISNLDIRFVVGHQLAKFLRELCSEMRFQFRQLINKRNLDNSPFLGGII
jgi:hypothetical protein